MPEPARAAATRSSRAPASGSNQWAAALDRGPAPRHGRPLHRGRLRRGRPPRGHARTSSTRRRSGALADAGPAALAAALENDLQQAALSLRPDLKERLDALAAAGALGAAVSGSGPTCFGLFADTATAAEAAAATPRRARDRAALTYPPTSMSAREIIAAVAAVLVAAYLVWRWRG